MSGGFAEQRLLEVTWGRRAVCIVNHRAARFVAGDVAPVLISACRGEMVQWKNRVGHLNRKVLYSHIGFLVVCAFCGSERSEILTLA